MTNEEIERTVQFILTQQAQFTANMEELRATQRELAQTQQRAEQKWERTEEGIRSLLAIAEIHEREINTAAESQSRLAEAHAKLAESQFQLAESQKETDERLNALINMVERYISERRNGKSQGDDAQH